MQPLKATKGRRSWKPGPFRYRFHGCALEESLQRSQCSLDQAETAMDGRRRQRGGGGRMCYPEALLRRRTLDGLWSQV